MKTQGRLGLGFHPYFVIGQKQDGRVVSSTRRSHFIPKEIPWYSFLLEAEWTPGLLSAYGMVRSRDNFQGPHRESNPGPSHSPRIIYKKIII
jgi:hypothetical protein